MHILEIELRKSSAAKKKKKNPAGRGKENRHSTFFFERSFFETQAR